MFQDVKKSYLNRASECIAQGALTNSKRPESFVKGIYPTHAMSGRDCRITDESGKEYIDFICGLGTNLLGYDCFVGSDFSRIFSSGITLSLSSTSEVDLAEELKPLFPFIEKIKILKSGSDGCTAALRIARAYRNKMGVLTDGYHGWHDEFLSAEVIKSKGITNDDYGLGTNIIKFRDLDQINKYEAAVIIEPIITDASEDRRYFLNKLREYCTREGLLLIFDETITAFRFPGGSVAAYWGIEPDLIIFGKALANGLPISVVGGKKAVMDNDYFVSTSFAGDRVAIEAARLVLKEVQHKKTLQRLWEDGGRFLVEFNAISDLVQIEGYNTRGVFKAKDDLTKALFFQEACKAGILFGHSWFWNVHHEFVIDRVINICKDILVRIKLGQVKLEGEMPVLPFAQKVRGE